MASTSPIVKSTASNNGTPNVKRTAGQASLEIRRDGSKRFRGCSKIGDYILMSKLGEGTFGEVHKAEHRRTGNVFALKKILMHQEKEGFPVTALREIKLLKLLSHPNVLKLEEMAVEKKQESAGRKKAVVYMVTPYMDHDLSGLLENPAVKFTEAQIKCYMIQLLEGVAYLHARNILHRDMKAANLLINNEGVLQIADFGLARPYDDPPPQSGNGNGDATRGYTTVVVTRWYRPPELLLQLRHYTPAIDIWGVGCVLGEMFKGHPILPGNSDLNQINQIWDLMGSPSEENMPGWSLLPGCDGVKTFQHRYGKLGQEFRDQGSSFIALMSELLKLDWRRRINAIDALDHPYFKNSPLPAKPGDIPCFQESHELDRRKFRELKAVPPPAPAGGDVGRDLDDDFADGHGHGHPPRATYHNGQQQQQLHYHNHPYPHHQQQLQYSQTRNGHVNRYPPPQINHWAPPPPPGELPPQRRPAWASQPNGLPPKPPPIQNGGLNYNSSGLRDGVRDRAPPRDGLNHGSRPPYDANRERPLPRDYQPRDRGSAGGPVRDTYIPDHSPRHRDGPPRPPREWGGSAAPARDTYIPDHSPRRRDEALRGRDGGPRRDERDRDRPREERRDDRDRGADRWEREDRDRGGDRKRMTRSRSPEWDRREREGSQRERHGAKDFYRR